MPNPAPFTRINLPDPATNQALQDVYNKLAQVQRAISEIQTSIHALDARIKKLEP